MKYAYPGVFTPEESGGFSVNFPDLESCYSCGDNLADAITMASDVLALVLYDYESKSRKIPEPSEPSSVVLAKGEFVNYVSCDTLMYRKMYNNKSVKKTLTVPEWLNEAATAAGLNFSQVLQEALKARLHLV